MNSLSEDNAQECAMLSAKCKAHFLFCFSLSIELGLYSTSRIFAHIHVSPDIFLRQRDSSLSVLQETQTRFLNSKIRILLLSPLTLFWRQRHLLLRSASSMPMFTWPGRLSQPIVDGDLNSFAARPIHLAPDLSQGGF